jgi:sporulation protein YlmC with PRC-barrel domain
VSRDAWTRHRDPGRVSRLIGLRAKDTAGQAAGRVRDLLIESDSGRVREVTVGVGGFLGFREDLASLEWSKVTLRPRYAQLDISTEKLAERCYPKEDYWQRLGFAGEREAHEPEIPMPTPPLTPLNPYY